MCRSPGRGTWTDAKASTRCHVGRRTPVCRGWCCRSCTRTRCHSRRGSRLADEPRRSGRRSPSWSAACWPSRFPMAGWRFSTENHIDTRLSRRKQNVQVYSFFTANTITSLSPNVDSSNNNTVYVLFLK